MKKKKSININFLGSDYKVEFDKLGEIKDTPTITKLLTEMRVYIFNIVKSTTYKSISRTQVENEDLVQELLIHSLKLIKAYDGRPGNMFKTFYYRCINNHMLNLLKIMKSRLRLNGSDEQSRDVHIYTDSKSLDLIMDCIESKEEVE